MDLQRVLAVAGVTVLLVLGGCLSGSGAGHPPSPTPTPAATASPTSSPSGCADWVSFYGLDSPGETAWAPDRIAIGYTVPGNASVFFVAFENDTVIGSTHVTTGDLDYGVTADGDGILLDEPLNGTHELRVGAYTDTNANGQFDRGTDTECRNDGEAVEAGPRRIDYDAIQFTPTTATNTPKPASPTATATPGGHERAMNQPDPDKTVLLNNEWNQSVTLRVRVIREATNTTVHDETYHLEPGVKRDVYHTTAADPDGIEEFTIVVTAQNTTERVTIKTNKCYGPAYAEIREDGTLYLYYAIC